MLYFLSFLKANIYFNHSLEGEKKIKKILVINTSSVKKYFYWSKACAEMEKTLVNNSKFC